MDAQVGIIRNQAVANGTEDIVELVALLHQAVLMNHLFILVTFKAMIFGKVVVMLKMVCQV